MNKMMTKGLVSVAAASMLSTLAFAGSSITTTAATTYYDTYPGVNLGIKSLSILESGVSGFGTTGKLTIKIPGNVHLREINNTTANASVFDGSNNLLMKNSTYLGTSSSPKDLVIDVNATTGGAGLYVYHADNNRSKIAELYASSAAGTAKVEHMYFSGSTSNAVEVVRYDTLFDLNTSSLGTVDAVADANRTVGKIYLDSTTDETVISLAIRSSATALEFFNLNDLNISADTNETGVVSFAVSDGDAAGATTASVTAASVQIATLVAQPMRLTHTGTVPNVSAGSTTAQGIVDFNLTAVGDITTDTSTIVLTIAGATTNLNETSGKAGAILDGNITDTGTVFNVDSTTDGNLSTPSTTTIKLEINGTITDTNVIEFKGNPLMLNTAATSTGTAVTATITGTGELSYLSIPAFTIANAVQDGATVIQEDNNATKYTATSVVPGRTLQSLVDINITELFASSFATTSGANQITLTLPTGYTYTSAPVATIYTQNTTTTADNVTLNAAISSNVATIQFNTAAGDIDLLTSTSTKEVVNVSAIKVSVPSTATEAEVVTIALAGNMLSSTKTLDVTSINAGTVVTTVAAVNELNTTVGTVGTATSIGNGYTAFDINETFIGQLTAGNSITVTLSDGAFAPDTTQSTTDASLTLSDPVGSDGNKTITYTVSSASTALPAGSRIHLPKVALTTVTAAKTVTATIGGTAGVTGSINVVKTELGNSTKANSIVSVTKGSVDVTAGELQITEGIASGFGATTTGYKLIAPVGISFTGKYYDSNKLQTSAGTATYSAYSTTASNGVVSTTFNTNDTLAINLPAVTAYIDGIKIKPVVNVNTTSVDGVQGIQIKDINSSGVIATTGLNLAYVGTIPTLTAAADATVAAAGTTSVVPTNATGTVTYVSADTAIATVDAAGTVTVDTNATAAATVVITATDSLTAQAASTTITVGTPAPVLLSGDITLAAGWNFVSAPFDGSIDVATIAAAGCSQVHLADTTTGFWGAAVTTGTATPGQGVAAYCAAAGTASYTGITPAATAFAMATNITATGSTAVPSTHAAYAVGMNFKVVGTPTATTFAEVITAGATGVMYYNGTAFDLSSEYTSAGFTGVADNAAQVIPAGASFYIQTN